ncbi:hypothetical protein KQY27_01545 [Methanobrevibacter sp. TMH8]|uniref:hypothetical protein n=1 Tax=Methanobrevibacter sp. TMH8 TaxID=2848611 RepID=UPI001CCCC8ED|nr:hypothetical protein [Methanobrevibacter sp. TMH8]MBZ9570230.1 hypothetical protein [Methanobrevibacter sp. TMH8]
MDKSIILIIILCILAVFVATVNTQPIYITLNDIKTTIEGETNKEPIVNLTNNNTQNITNNNNNNQNNNINNLIFNDNKKTTDKIKIYNKSGIYFQYPSYWNYDQFKKLISLFKKEYISRWDDGIIFYISDYPINEELKIQQETERYKHPKNITVDNKKAFSLSTTKADYWQYLILVQKNQSKTYVITFYCDQELKKQDKVLFDEILSTMKLN